MSQSEFQCQPRLIRPQNQFPAEFTESRCVRIRERFFEVFQRLGNRSLVALHLLDLLNGFSARFSNVVEFHRFKIHGLQSRGGSIASIEQGSPETRKFSGHPGEFHVILERFPHGDVIQDSELERSAHRMLELEARTLEALDAGDVKSPFSKGVDLARSHQR